MGQRCFNASLKPRKTTPCPPWQIHSAKSGFRSPSQSPGADNVIAKCIREELVKLVIGELFNINPTQAADQFERFTRSSDEIAGGFWGGLFGIHANTNGADARNFKLALSVR